MTTTVPGNPASTPAQRRRERERAAARATILGAATELARNEGWDAVTMRRLADQIDYSANFAYRYFKSRDDILLTLARDGFARLRNQMAPPAADNPTPAPSLTGFEGAAATIRSAGHAYLDFALTEPELYQLMYSLGAVRIPTTDTWADGQAVGDVLLDPLHAAGDAQAEAHVLQLWATAHGLVALLVVGRVDIDVVALHAVLDDAITDVLARALPTHPKPGSRPAPNPVAAPRPAPPTREENP